MNDRPQYPSASFRKKKNRTGRLAAVVTAAWLLGLLPMDYVRWGSSASNPQIIAPVAEAQNFGQRTIQGKVLGEGDEAVQGATVFLENAKTRDVKSFTSTADGSFRFTQVGMVDDYQVWAEKGKKKSSVKTISSFDSRKELYFDFHLK